MTRHSIPRSLPLHLGTGDDGRAVRLLLDGRGAGLVVFGEQAVVSALARSLLVHLAAVTRAPVAVRADDRITVDGVPVVALQPAALHPAALHSGARHPADLHSDAPYSAAFGRPPPPGGDVPVLHVHDAPWGLLEPGGLSVRCDLVSRAEFPARFEAARARGARLRGRHARADENGGDMAASVLIS